MTTYQFDITGVVDVDLPDGVNEDSEVARDLALDEVMQLVRQERWVAEGMTLTLLEFFPDIEDEPTPRFTVHTIMGGNDVLEDDVCVWLVKDEEEDTWVATHLDSAIAQQDADGRNARVAVVEGVQADVVARAHKKLPVFPKPIGVGGYITHLAECHDTVVPGDRFYTLMELADQHIEYHKNAMDHGWDAPNAHRHA